MLNVGTRSVLVCDIDNTLLRSWEIYDEAYARTSRQLFGVEFQMTRNPDGTYDPLFSKLSNGEIFRRRVEQCEIELSLSNEEKFFEAFDRQATGIAAAMDSYVFEGVHTLLTAASGVATLVLLSSGTKGLQTKVLERANLLHLFDSSRSCFFGDFPSKQMALEKIAAQLPAKGSLVHLADAPADMRATKAAITSCPRVAVGTTVAGLSTSEELINAGADLVVHEYNQTTAKRLVALLTN